MKLLGARSMPNPASRADAHADIMLLTVLVVLLHSMIAV